MILEFEQNASLLQVLLCFQQVGVRRAKCQMAQGRLGGTAGLGRRLVRTQRKQGNTSRAGAKHGGAISPLFPVTMDFSKSVTARATWSICWSVNTTGGRRSCAHGRS